MLLLVLFCCFLISPVGPLLGGPGSSGEDRVSVSRVHRRGRPCLSRDQLHVQTLTGGSGQSCGREHPHRWLTLTVTSTHRTHTLTPFHDHQAVLQHKLLTVCQSVTGLHMQSVYSHQSRPWWLLLVLAETTFKRKEAQKYWVICSFYERKTENKDNDYSDCIFKNRERKNSKEMLSVLSSCNLSFLAA